MTESKIISNLIKVEKLKLLHDIQGTLCGIVCPEAVKDIITNKIKEVNDEPEFKSQGTSKIYSQLQEVVRRRKQSFQEDEGSGS